MRAPWAKVSFRVANPMAGTCMRRVIDPVISDQGCSQQSRNTSVQIRKPLPTLQD
jgi:hypothetical protein